MFKNGRSTENALTKLEKNYICTFFANRNNEAKYEKDLFCCACRFGLGRM